MKSFLLIFFLTFTLNANHVVWNSDYEKSHQKAIAEKKPLFILLIDNSKPTCQDIFRDTFVDKDYIQKINTKFIPVVIIKNQTSDYPIELLYTLEYPAIFILDRYELFLCDKLSGEISPKRLEHYLNSCF
jgi:thioredoxin-related protein